MSSPLRNLSFTKKNPYPGFLSGERWSQKCKKFPISEAEVRAHLKQFPEVLEEFLLEFTSEEYLENIIAQSPDPTCASENPDKSCSEAELEKCSFKIMACGTDAELLEEIFHLCTVIQTLIGAETFNVYNVEHENNSLSIYNPKTQPEFTKVGSIGYKMTVSAHVAAEKQAVNIRNLTQDIRFPKGISILDTNSDKVMCLPVLHQPDGTFAVAEFINGWEREEFTKVQFELAIAIFSWVSECIQEMKASKTVRPPALNTYLLDTTKVLFDDMGNIEELVTDIMRFTKDLVKAERCSFFLLDDNGKELFADYFDEGKVDSNKRPIFCKKPQIRFPKDRGIAGYVASTREVVNIADAYSDERFNPEVDKITGFRTKSILCMPIVSNKSGVMGVVQMINRVDGEPFSSQDEVAFKTFAVYCALALHYSRIQHLLVKEKAKYKVAMEGLQYHSTCANEDIEQLATDPYLADDQIPADFIHYNFCSYDHVHRLPKLFVRMVLDLFDDTFDVRKLCKFALTVRNNYRLLPYHNWHHGFHVAHSLWQMIRTDKLGVFSECEKMALLFSGLCHDIDYRGYDIEFTKQFELPIATLYSTSARDQHHYQQTIVILHADGCDLFSVMKPDEHGELLDMIRTNMLATDLSSYFANQKFLTRLQTEGTFSMSDPEHKAALCKLMMTAADLSVVCKPWDTQKKTMDLLYDEFYTLKDGENTSLLQTIPLSAQIRREDIPKEQYRFLEKVCLPVYSTLAHFLPGTKPLLDGVIECKRRWSEDIEQVEMGVAGCTTS